MSDTLTDIRDACEQLCDPHHHAEPRWGWDEHRNRKPLPPHRTVQPGLIQQLRDAIEPGDSASAGSTGGGLLPGDINAVSLLASIEHGSRWRSHQWGIAKGRITAEDHIRGLAAEATRRTFDETRLLRAELRSWTWQAEVITGWRTPSRPLAGPCPACEAHGTLLARVDDSDPSAACVGCGERWDSGTVGILARHVIAYQNRVQVERSDARARAVEARRRQAGQTRAVA